MKPFTLIGISGSPRKESNTDILVKQVLSAAADKGAATDFVKIADHKISPCDACWRCSEKGLCHITDDMQPIYPKLLHADGIVIGSPVHMGHSISGHAQIFLVILHFFSFGKGGYLIFLEEKQRCPNPN